MRTLFLAIPISLGVAAAQEQLTMKELKLEMGQTATRAVGNFRSADSIEANLRAQNAVLHPQLTALRLRVEAALDEAEAALERRDTVTAEKAITRARALLDQFARKIGGA
jgi:hypothetical protein